MREHPVERRCIAVVGEALVDLVPTSSTSYDVRPGGSPANTAVALARLGTPVTMLARFGSDAFGSLLLRHLRDNGVGLDHAVCGTGPSSVALATRAPDGSASYRFFLDATVDWQWTADELPTLPESVAALHAGSLALARATALEPWVASQRASVTTCIDPNLRPELLPDDPVARVERWVQLADIVKASADDIALLHPSSQALDVARRWARSGPALVVVTEGATGATAFFGDASLHLAAMPVEVVDTIGAGDAFTAGLLHELGARGRLGGRIPALTKDDVAAAMETATIAAALTCARVGADPPRAAEVSAARR